MHFDLEPGGDAAVIFDHTIRVRIPKTHETSLRSNIEGAYNIKQELFGGTQGFV